MAPVAVAPTTAVAHVAMACDPRAAPGDLANPSGRFMGQLSLDGVVQNAFPTDVVATPDGYQERLVKGDLPCYAEGILKTSAVKDGYVSCSRLGAERVVLMFDAPLTAIPGGYRVEARAHDAGFRDQSKPPVVLALVLCREPWPPGFVSDFDRP
jgi:hypothetical protein